MKRATAIFLISVLLCSSFKASTQVTGGGDRHSVVLCDDSSAWATGYNFFGQLGDGTTTQRIVPVQVSSISGVTMLEVGDNHAVALLNDGTAWTWGYDFFG